MIPTVIETSGRGERAFDIYSRLLRERIVFLGQEVRDENLNTRYAIFLKYPHYFSLKSLFFAP